MSRIRSRRFGTIMLMVLSLLFMQLALAQYVCPVDADEAQGVAAAMEMAPGQPCSGMDWQGDEPQLCHQHCANVAQSYEPVKLPSVSLPAIAQVFVIPASISVYQPDARLERFVVQAQPPPAPVFLSTLRLRV